MSRTGGGSPARPLDRVGPGRAFPVAPALAPLALAALALAGCPGGGGDAPAGGEATRPETTGPGDASAAGAPPGALPPALVVGLDSDPTNLDPRRATDAASSRILDLVCEGLVRVDASGALAPALAESWETPDDRTVLFHLAPDARFHDGTPVTGADVVATYRSVLDPATASPHRGGLASVESIEVLLVATTWEDKGDIGDTVVVKLSRPDAPLLSSFTRGVLSAAQLADPEARISEAPLCSGPYRVERVASGDRVVLAASEAAREPPAIGSIVFRVVVDETTRLLELRKGSIHFGLNAVEPDRVGELESDPRFRVLARPSANVTYLGFNLTDPALADVRVRRALAHALDREAIVEHLLGGRAALATGLLPPGHWAHEADVATYAHDPARARALLDEAGLADPDGPEPRLRLVQKTTESKLRQRIAQVFQAQLAEVGVATEIRTSEWGTFYEDVKSGNFQLYALSWVGLVEPDILWSVFHSANQPPVGANRGRYASAEVDRLTEAARTTLDPAARREAYAAVQRLLADDLPYVFLWHEEHVAVLDARLEGFELTPTGELSSLARTRWVDPGAGPAAGGAAP